MEWNPPSIPNGVIQSYQVEVLLLNEEGHLVFTQIYTVMVGVWLHVCVHERISTYTSCTHLQGNITSYFFNLSLVSNEKLKLSRQVAFRVAAENAFLISNFSDASNVSLTSGTVKLVSADTP